jgi:hypothetical protein
MGGQRGRGVALLTALVLVVVLGAAAATATVLRGSPQPWSQARVDGRTARAVYTGSSCQDGARLLAEEADDEVVLTVVTWSFATSCDDVGVTRTVSADLADALGDREVVDGACALPRFREHGDCTDHPTVDPTG